MSYSSSYTILVTCSLLCITMATATQFKVGGSMGWTVPSDPNTMSYNSWASRNRFSIGDSLLFVYPAGKDSVLLVTQESYTTCNTANYVQKYTDGNTVITLDHSGPHYFISGNEGNCLKKESMVVVVMADRSVKNMAPPPQSPPSPVMEVPPPQPMEASPPTPVEEVPPPSPAGESSPAPESDQGSGGSAQQQPNGAGLKVAGSFGGGLIMGSFLVLLL